MTCVVSVFHGKMCPSIAQKKKKKTNYMGYPGIDLNQTYFCFWSKSNKKIPFFINPVTYYQKRLKAPFL